MGLFSIGESRTTQKVFAPVDRSAVTAGGEASVAVREGGAHFNTNTLGVAATQFTIGRNSSLTINQTSDPELIKSVFDTQQKNFASVFEGTDQRLEKVLEQIGTLAESKQTGGESGRDKTILYVVLAGVAGLALIFGKRSGFYIIAAGAAAYFLFGGKKDKAP